MDAKYFIAIRAPGIYSITGAESVPREVAERQRTEYQKIFPQATVSLLEDKPKFNATSL